ncbi:lysozyme [Cupriavidus basilensis]
MKTSANGLAVIKYFETCRLKAYLCPAGIPTIGWGHTGPDVRMGMTISLARADELLEQDIAAFERIVSAAVTTPLTQGQFDALVSFCFNVGPGVKGREGRVRDASQRQPSTLLRRVNAGDWAGAAAQIPLWNKAGGVVQKGLVRRRASERALSHGATGADAIALGRSAA